jgi:hypothetical protein
MRSFIIRGGSAAALALGITACSATTTATVPVTLTNAQQEAAALVTAFTALAGSNPSPAVATALKAAQAAEAAFAAVQPGKTEIQDAEAVVNELEPLISLIPIPGVSALEIDAGIALVEGLVNGATAVAAPATTPALGAVPTKVIAAPIPIAIPAS